MNATIPNRPTHRLYAIHKGQDGKKYWQPIGAAWPHGDGDGFNLKLEFLPLNPSAELVLRKPKADERDAQGAEGGAP